MLSKHILVLEDDSSLNELYSRLLRKAGYAVFQAETLAEARVLLRKVHFDLCICDMHVGAGSAIKLIDQYSVFQRLGMKIIVISGENRYANLCESMGIKFYLKPVTRDALLAAVRAAFDSTTV